MTTEREEGALEPSAWICAPCRELNYREDIWCSGCGMGRDAAHHKLLYTEAAMREKLAAEFDGIATEIDSEGALLISMVGGDIYRTVARYLRRTPTTGGGE